MASDLDDRGTDPAALPVNARPIYHRVATTEEAIEQYSGLGEHDHNHSNPLSLRREKKARQGKRRHDRKRQHGQKTSTSFIKRKGWRLGILIGLCTSLVVLLGNVVIALLGTMRNGGYVDGIGILNIGEAGKMANINTAYHVLINVLSTALLTSSNFCMQILCSPTREEVDAAHNKGKWVSIGILSPGNLQYTSNIKRIMWWLLALSSLPLHLLYNTSIFAVISAQEYDVTVANGSDAASINHLASGNMKTLSNDEWTQLYDTQYVANAGDLVLVADGYWCDANLPQDGTDWEISEPQLSADPPLDLVTLYERDDQIQGVSGSFGAIWQLNGNGTVSIIRNQTQYYRVLFDLSISPPSLSPFLHVLDTGASSLYNYNFSVTFHISPANATSIFAVVELNDAIVIRGGPRWLRDPNLSISYGLSQQIDDGSQVQISRTFILVVICCNIVKAVIIYLTFKLTSSTSFEPLITVGDVVASYLEKPDQRTAGACLYDVEGLMNHKPEDSPRPPKTWQPKRRLLSSAAMGDKFLEALIITGAVCIGLFILGIAIAFPNSGSGIYANGGMTWGSRSQRQISFAKSSFDAHGVLFNAWLANAPQVLLSISYVITNRFCTSMSFALEWDQYASQRKGLRVSNPSEEQRGTYFLQLPFRCAVPLVVISGLSHWLLSQAIFLVRLDIRDRTGNVITSESKSTCGYSFLSIFVFLIIFGCLQVVVLTLMLWRVTPKMPIVASCSLVISATCHPPNGELDTHLRSVQWGVIPAEFGTVAHCTFSKGPVMPPRSGCEYA